MSVINDQKVYNVLIEIVTDFLAQSKVINNKRGGQEIRQISTKSILHLVKSLPILACHLLVKFQRIKVLVRVKVRQKWVVDLSNPFYLYFFSLIFTHKKPSFKEGNREKWKA